MAQACATAYCRNVISGREAAQQIEDGVLAGRGSNRTGLHSRTEEMASALSRFRRTLALPESGDRSTVSRRLDSHRLPGSYRSEIRTWQDRISHVPSHIPCVAGRDRSTRGVQQKLMRHAHVSTTMDQYGNASALAKRKANRPIVQRLLKRPANQQVSIQ